MTMIWNCTLQKMCPDIKHFSSCQSFLSSCLHRAVRSRSAFSVYGGKKNVIANSNMSVSLSQVSLSETEERFKKKMCLSCSELFDVT